MGKNHRLSNTYQIFSFLAKLNFLKDSFNTTLYLLDFIRIWPTFGLFHYAKLPSYKRVRWGRLAGPSLTACLCIHVQDTESPEVHPFGRAHGSFLRSPATAANHTPQPLQDLDARGRGDTRSQQDSCTSTCEEHRTTTKLTCVFHCIVNKCEILSNNNIQTCIFRRLLNCFSLSVLLNSGLFN